MGKRKKDDLSTIPQLNLKGEDYGHIVPEHITITLFIEFKKGGLVRDEVSNVAYFEKRGDNFTVINSHNKNYRYIYSLKELKKVFVILDSSGGDSG